MAIHERGYRPYGGTFHSRRAPFAIADTGIRIILKTWGFRLLALLTILIFLIVVVGLYVELQAEQGFDRLRRSIDDGASSKTFESMSVERLRVAFTVFLTSASALGAVIALLTGAGIVADDIRSRALSLYLVRPIQPLSYALGKALIVPLTLGIVLLVPGLLLVCLVALWQVDIGFWEFLSNHPDLLGVVFRTWLIASLSYTGVMLFFSSRTPRRGRVVALSAAVYFGGMMIAGIGAGLRGTMRDVLKHASLVGNAMTEAILATLDMEKRSRHAERMRETLPDLSVVWWVAIAVFVIGFYTVWRRASTVEVTG
jgi:ABC-type transport system involved in multi-copper enzyme maturation permease subunit